MDHRTTRCASIIRKKLMPLVLFCARRVSPSARLQHAADHFKQHFRTKSDFRSAQRLYSHIQLLPLRWFDNRATGDLSRFSLR